MAYGPTVLNTSYWKYQNDSYEPRYLALLSKYQNKILMNQGTWHYLKNSITSHDGALLYAESISAWSNHGSIMCLLSILNQ